MVRYPQYPQYQQHPQQSYQLALPTVWATIVVTFFLGLFGLIPAIMHTNRAKEAGRPWVASPGSKQVHGRRQSQVQPVDEGHPSLGHWRYWRPFWGVARCPYAVGPGIALLDGKQVQPAWSLGHGDHREQNKRS